jgi:hypothetical protein
MKLFNKKTKPPHPLLEGDKFKFKNARKALPILVRQAKIGQKIYYSELAEEIGVGSPQSIGGILGTIGDALKKFEYHSGKKIPPIQCLVVRKKTELPGEGFAEFLKNEKEYLKSPKSKRAKIIDKVLADIYIYPHWEEILQQLNLEPIDTIPHKILEEAKKSGYGKGGESEEHRQFKEFIAQNPKAIKLPARLQGEIEYVFLSQDKIDIRFKEKNRIIGVEVKSKNSPESDILRGILQCVKYKALIEAEQILNEQEIDHEVILVLQGSFPESLIPTRNKLGVKVIDEVEQKP